MELLALLVLAAVPLAGAWYARAYAPRHTWLFTGVALGLVISPLSTGLYSTFFLSPLGFPTGMLGLVSTLFHGAPGYQFALWLGVVPPNEVVSGVGHVYIELLNGVFWAAIYGILGFIVDWARLVHSRRVS